MAPAAVYAVGVALTAFSIYQQGQYQKRVGKYNAEMARREGEIQKARGDIELKQHQDRVRRLKGSQKVAYLKSGVQLGRGSALEVLADTEAQAALDEEIIKYNTAAGVWGKEAEAGLSLMKGRQGEAAGYLGAGSELLKGYGTWDYRYRKQNKAQPTIQ